MSFEEGDPDRPVVTGRMYHAEMRPPCDLPSAKTVTVLRSSSSPGGRGFNELRMEDRKGEEEISVRAEKDMALYAGNDWSDYTRNERHSTVKKNLYLEVQGETHARHKGNRKTELDAGEHLAIHGARHEQIDKSWLVNTKQEVHIRAGTKIVLDAGTEITIKAGSSFIRLDPSGVHIKGTILGLNSGGSAGKGTPAAPQLPDTPGNPAERLMAAAREIARAGVASASPGKPGGAGGKGDSASGNNGKSGAGGKGTSAVGGSGRSGADKKGGAAAGAQQRALADAHAAAQPLTSDCAAAPKEKDGGK